MENNIKCDKCHSLLDTNTVCDTCEKICEFHEIGESELILKLNDTDYHFCNYQCLFKFITNELQKEEK